MAVATAYPVLMPNNSRRVEHNLFAKIYDCSDSKQSQHCAIIITINTAT